MTKKIYRVTRHERSSAYVFVEAESKDKASEIANEIAGDGWHENQNYEADYTVAVTSPAELHAKQYIETATGLRRYDNSPV